MKTVILALVVLLVVSQGEALRCYCGGRTHCSSRVQTCSGSNKVCARITFTHEISEQTRENMKTVILALVVLLIVSQGEALTCWCGGIRLCSGRTETCSSSEDVCASVSFTRFQINEQTRENMKTVILALVVLLVVSQEISEQTRENMKTVTLALVVLLVVSQGEALRCYCGGLTHCSSRIQTCSGSNKVCARITFKHGEYRLFLLFTVHNKDKHPSHGPVFENLYKFLFYVSTDNSYFQSCYDATACKNLIETDEVSGRCCGTNQCN
ncbi:hypothetical protein ABVT39_024491 [Epinephelus coioides]